MERERSPCSESNGSPARAGSYGPGFLNSLLKCVHSGIGDDVARGSPLKVSRPMLPFI
jgi:hypothetical protein